MPELIPVPEEVAHVAAAALSTRSDRGGGGTARGVVIATALSTGFVTAPEVAELRDWHARNPDAIVGNQSTLLAGLYGGIPARDAWPPEPTPEPVVAATVSPLKARLAKLSRAVLQADHRLMLRLHAGATVALEEAIRHAGSKVVAKARGQQAKNVATAAVSAGRITAVLAAVGVTEQELLDRKFEAYAATATALIVASERRKLAAAARALQLDSDELDRAYEPEILARATAASAMLVGALELLARNALSGHAVTPEASRGEFSGPVPFGIVRSAFQVAAHGATPPVIDESGPGPAPIEALTRRLEDAGRSIVEELLVEHVGPVQLRSTWSVGDPSRPFEPHQNLDGVSWVDTQPDELAADPGEWPYVDVYQPGDHDGCQCMVDTEYEPYEGDGAPAEVGEMVTAGE